MYSLARSKCFTVVGAEFLLLADTALKVREMRDLAVPNLFVVS